MGSGFSQTGWEDTSSAAICVGYIRKGHRACDNKAIERPNNESTSQIILQNFEGRDSRTNFKYSERFKKVLCE
jgi:hypothetical protein